MLPISFSFLHGLLLASCFLASGTWASPVFSISFLSEGTTPTTPTPVHVTPSFVADVVENTHTFSIGANGNATPTPIVGGPECWFCPGADSSKNTTGGWALLGIEKAGIYQPYASEFLETVPIVIVSSEGNPKYHPSRTTNKPATKAKRKSAPTTTETEYWEKYDMLKKHIKGDSIQIGEGYAMKAKLPKKKLGVKVPDHYLLITGYIRKAWDDDEYIPREDCGDEDDDDAIEVRRTAIVDFDAIVYDIGREGKEIQFLEREKTADTWDRQEKFEYTYLGRIKPGLTRQTIKSQANDLVKEMNDAGGYNKLWRNCNDFVKKLYKRLART